MALKQQFLSAWNCTDAGGTTTVYANPLCGGRNVIQQAAGGVASHTAIMPAAGTIRNLRAMVTVALAGVATVAFTVMKNGVDTGLTLTLNSSTQSAESTTAVSFVAGDTITLKRVFVGTAPKLFVYSLEWEPTAADVSVYGWGNSGSDLSANQMDGVFCGGQGWSASGESQIDLLAIAGTLTALRMNLATAPGGVTSRTFTIYKNGVAQDGSGGTVDTRLTISGTSTTGSVSFSLSLVAGDRLAVFHTVSGVPAASKGSGTAAFTSAVANSWNICGDLGTTAISSAATNYHIPMGDGGTTGSSATESDVEFQCPITPLILSGLRVALDVAPGAGKSWVFTLRKDGADTAQTVTIADAATSASFGAGSEVTYTSGSKLAVKSVPSGTPTAPSGHRWAFAAAQAEIKGSAVFGVTGTVKASRAVLFSLDDAVNVLDEEGKLKVCGEAEVTDALTVEDAELRFVTVALSSGDILALRATPKTLVAAPGAGRLLEFVSAVLLLDATATAYVESAANLAVKYTNGSGAKVSDDIEATGFIDQTADTMTRARPKLDAIVAKSGCENQALVLHNLGAGEYTTGTGVMRVKVTYRVWSTGW